MTTSLTIRPRRRSRCFPHFALTLISTTIFRRPPALGAASRRIGRCRRCRRCALPKTPLEETVLGLKVEVERLVEELDLLRSRSELSASAHRQAVVDHAVERSALVLQAAQKGELVALAKRDIKELTDELHTTSTKATELNSANLLIEEKARLSDLYITYLEAGHPKFCTRRRRKGFCRLRAPAGGIVLQTKLRFSASTWLALGAVRRSKDLMAKDFLIPEGVLVRPFIVGPSNSGGGQNRDF